MRSKKIKIKHFKSLTSIYFFLLLFFSIVVSNIAHELVHVLQSKSQGFEPVDVCFLGYTKRAKDVCGWVSFPVDFTLTNNNTLTKILFFNDIEFLPTLVEYFAVAISTSVGTALFILSIQEERGVERRSLSMKHPLPLPPQRCWICGKEGVKKINLWSEGKKVSSIWLCERCFDEIEKGD